MLIDSQTLAVGKAKERANHGQPSASIPLTAALGGNLWTMDPKSSLGPDGALLSLL